MPRFYPPSYGSVRYPRISTPRLVPPYRPMGGPPRPPRLPTPRATPPAAGTYPPARGGPGVVAPQNQGAMLGGGYTPYRGPGAPAPPTFQAPGAYLTDDQIQSQAAARAKAIYDPLIQQIVDSINNRGRQGAADLAALTGEYAQAAGQYAAAIPGIYGPAKAETATAAQFLADRLKGEGASTGQDLASSLQQAGVQGPGDINLAQMGAGAGNVAYGTGIAELDRLIANQASAQTFAAGEPSRAFAGGQQALGSYEKYLGNLLATQQGQLTAQIPGTAEQIAESLYGRQDQQRTFNEGVREFNAQQAANAASRAQQGRQFAATQAENQRRYNAGVRQHQQDIARAAQQRRASIAGRNAPTVAGRQAYWDSIAAQRTRDKGVVYAGTSTGIKPVIDPKTGQPQLTDAGRADRASLAASQENTKNAKVSRILTLGSRTRIDPKTGQQTVVYTPQARARVKALTGVDPGRGPATTTKPDYTPAKLHQAAVKEAHRHSETMGRINAEIAATNARIAHNKATERNSAASIDERRAATAARVADEKRRESLQKASDAETARHHKVGEMETRRHHTVTEKKSKSKSGSASGL